MPWFPRSSDLVSCWASSKRDSHVSSHGFPQLLESHSRLQHFHEEMVSLAECSGCHRGTGCIYETIPGTTQSHGCHVKEAVFLRPQNLKLNMTRCCVRWGMFLLCRNWATFWNECRVVNVTSSVSSSVDLNMNVLWAVGKSDTTWGWAE